MSIQQFYEPFNREIYNPIYERTLDNSIPKYIAQYRIYPILEVIPEGKYIYEFTITYDRQFWSYTRMKQRGVIEAIQMITRELDKLINKYRLDYSIEYHKTGHPHVHGQIFTDFEVEAGVLKKLQARACKDYGRTQIYQTERLDHPHEKEGKLVKWSEYIRKDIKENNSNGLIHGYSIVNSN